jgi:hypothetical protein
MTRLLRAIFLLPILLIGSAFPVLAQDATSSTLQLLIMGSGLHLNDWGTQTNLNFGKIEAAIAGATSLTLGGSNYTLSDTDARSAIINLSGTLSANIILTVPSRVKSWIILNGTSGAFTVSIKTSGGSAIVLPQGISSVVWSDGTAMRSAPDLSAYASSSTVSAVSAVASAALARAGGSMTGAIDLGSNKITTLGTPTATTDATAYVDAAVAAALAAVVTTPAGAVMAFNLSACPTGWLNANGSATALDLRGQFIRGLDQGAGVDPSRTLASAQADDFKSHTHSGAPSGSIGVNTSSSAFIPSGASGTTGATGGTETRPKNIALLYCQKS